MSARCLTILTILTLSLGLAACGSDNELSTDIPRTSPDLTIPTASSQTGGAAPAGQSTTGGATAGGGEFENFCAQNPGAC
jgi:hypothetical protein